MLHNVWLLEAGTTSRSEYFASNIRHYILMMVFIGENTGGDHPSGNLETKNTSFFRSSSCISCVLPNI